MISRRHMLHLAGAAAAAPFVHPHAGLAQEAFPSRPITLICPFATGSGADLFTRFYANKLKEVSGATTIVENKVGAAGAIGAQYVARSKPDGYTLFVIPGSNIMAVTPRAMKQPGFDPLGDFEHITTLAQQPSVLVVAANSPYRSVADLVAGLKAKGDKASYGATSNPGTVLAELFKSHFDLKAVEVKFKDFASALNEMLAGSISFVFLDSTQSMGHIAGGRVRGLMQSGGERTSTVRDIPAAGEIGVANMNYVAWWSAHVPKGTPPVIVQAYEKWFDTITRSDDTIAFRWPGRSGTGSSTPGWRRSSRNNGYERLFFRPIPLYRPTVPSYMTIAAST